MLCYVSSENGRSQVTMPLLKCWWQHFVLQAFLLAFCAPMRTCAQETIK